MIITLDGPAGTGKTTVAKDLAVELGYTYFDTGAMYRAVTYGIMKNSIDPDNAEALQSFLQNNPITVKSSLGQKKFFVGTEDATSHIRTKEVTDYVSKISSIKAVRDALVATQRQLAVGVNAVFEGRDMGSVVFPNADVKVFLTATLQVRATRRYNELMAKDPNNTSLSLDSVLQDIDRRDKQDESRDISPTKAAPDAAVIDTSNLSTEEVVNLIVNSVKDLQDRPLRQK